MACFQDTCTISTRNIIIHLSPYNFFFTKKIGSLILSQGSCFLSLIYTRPYSFRCGQITELCITKDHLKVAYFFLKSYNKVFYEVIAIKKRPNICNHYTFFSLLFLALIQIYFNLHFVKGSPKRHTYSEKPFFRP